MSSTPCAAKVLYCHSPDDDDGQLNGECVVAPALDRRRAPLDRPLARRRHGHTLERSHAAHSRPTSRATYAISRPLHDKPDPCRNQGPKVPPRAAVGPRQDRPHNPTATNDRSSVRRTTWAPRSTGSRLRLRG